MLYSYIFPHIGLWANLCEFWSALKSKTFGFMRQKKKIPDKFDFLILSPINKQVSASLQQTSVSTPSEQTFLQFVVCCLLQAVGTCVSMINRLITHVYTALCNRAHTACVSWVQALPAEDEEQAE